VPRYAVLLRGINVGRAKRVAMADLRDLLTDLGYSEVRTLLQSGNAVVTGKRADTGKQAARIETALADRTGVQARCLVLTEAALRAAVEVNPLAEVAVEGSKMMVHFLSADPDPALLAEHDPIALDPGNARLGPGVIYQWCPDGVLKAPAIGGLVEKRLGLVVTARNWNTATKLAALL
jgi:uncharacterized protein (DUF1697 family)